MNHSFNTNVAQKIGVNEAIMIENMAFWIAKNKANKKHFHDGYYWTFNSCHAFQELFPYWSESQIRRILKKLLDSNVLKSGCYNKNAYDRTLWYTIIDKSILRLYQINYDIPSNQTDETNEPIPDINTINKPDINTYIYNKIDFKDLLDYWNKLKIRTHSLQTIKKQIKKRHSEYIQDLGIEKTKEAMKNYADILKSDDYYWSHSWSFWDFIGRGLYNFVDEAMPFKNYKTHFKKKETSEERLKRLFPDWYDENGNRKKVI